MSWGDRVLEKYQRWGARLRFGSLNLLDFSMWLGWLSTWFLIFVVTALEVGPQLALFYTSPLWLTLIVGVLGFRPLGMVVYTIIVFVVVQSFLQSYPVHCRELWKEKLMFDSTWNAEEAFEALREDRENLMPGAGAKELKKWARLVFHHTRRVAGVAHDIGSKASDHVASATDGTFFAATVHRRLDVADAVAASGFGDTAAAAALRGAADAETAAAEAPPFWLSTNTSAAAPTTSPAPANQTTSKDLADFEPRFPNIGAVGDLELKIYCSMHRRRAAHTENTTEFPCCAYIFGQSSGSGFFEDLFRYLLEVHCHPWTCTFTEQHSHASWHFMMMPPLCVIVTMLHYMFRGYRILEVMLGTGQLRTWWAWFWAGFFPIWSAMYVVYIRDFSIGDLFEWAWDHTLYILADMRALLIIVGIFLLGLIIQTNKERIYQVLGIDDHRVIHWLNTQRSNRTVAHAFQVCIWRIDVNAIASIETFNHWEISMETTPPVGGLGDQSDFDGDVRGSNTSWLSGFGHRFTGGYRTLSRRAPAERARETFSQRGKKTLRISGGHAPALFVRLAYGHNEIQNTRVQRLVRPLTDNGVCYFQENFRLIQEPDDDTCLFIEVRDQTLVGAHDLGRVHFDGEGLQRQFDRAARQQEYLHSRGAGVRGGDMAAEQVVRMMEERAENNRWNENQEGEAMRRKMWEAGFAPHPLSEGGAIWLAMHDLGPDGPSSSGDCAVS